MTFEILSLRKAHLDTTKETGGVICFKRTVKKSCKKKGNEKMSKYPNLMKPITFRKMTVKNRVFLPPMKTNYINADHSLSEEIIQYYEEMAKGGIGLVTTEAAEVDGDHLYDATILGIFDDAKIEGFKKLADKLHQYDTKLSVQLIQGGPYANSTVNQGRMPLSSSAIAHVWNPLETPAEMTHKDIKRYVQKYVDAALRVQKAGCDAVEVHCAHAHALLGSFLSPLVNHRADEYGGDITGRARFLIEVCEAIRQAVGEDFPVSVRLSADDCEEGGNSAFDNAYVCRLLEKAGVDYIHFTNGTLYDVGSLLPPTGKPHALNVGYTDIIRKATTIPFGVVGRIKEPWIAEMLLEQDRMDMVYIGRAHICDPHFVKKSVEGEFDDVRPCIGCLHCLATSALGVTMECTMNPEIADWHLKEIKPAQAKKKVVVVGSGASGLEAAATAAKRGHEVVLIEKENKLGGQFAFASFPPVKQELAPALKWMIREVKKAGVEIRLNTEATVESVLALNPDEIIVATGGKPVMPKFIMECDHPNVVSAWDILRGRVPAGMNVVVIGGGSVGCETAEFIAPRHSYRGLMDRKITLIEMLDNLDVTDGTANRDYLMKRLAEKPIDIQTGARVTEISQTSVTYEKNEEEVTLEGVDTVIVAIGTLSENELAEALESAGKSVQVIGDANEVGKIVNATAAGRKAAMQI